MFLRKLRNKLREILTGIDGMIDKRIELALKITTGLKQMLSSPVADIITVIIPGNIDNIIRQQLISILGRATEVLSIADTCRQHADVNDKLSCFIHQLKLHDPLLQDALLQKLASLITSGLDGDRLKQSMYDLYTQAKYAATKEDVAL